MLPGRMAAAETWLDPGSEDYCRLGISATRHMWRDVDSNGDLYLTGFFRNAHPGSTPGSGTNDFSSLDGYGKDARSLAASCGREAP